MPSVPPLEAGMLVVASPLLGDPNFAASVVLLLDVAPPGGPVDPAGLGVAGDDGGAVGVILDRSSGVVVSDVLSAWAAMVDEPGLVHQGGPVGPEGAIALARLRPGAAAPIGFRALRSTAEPGPWDRVGVLDLDTPVELVRDAVGSLRVFAGYAGWGSGQLEQEVAEGHWYVVPGAADDVFAPDPAALRREVLRRQPGDLSWHSTRPADPGLN